MSLRSLPSLVALVVLATSPLVPAPPTPSTGASGDAQDEQETSSSSSKSSSSRAIDAASSRRPNVLFIFSDDQTFEAVRNAGRLDIDTPNLDRLAGSGMTFTRAYNMGSWSGAVCVASRTMLNTGRFVWHAHSVWAASEKERSEGRWWSEILRGAGYETYFSGKWHLRASAEASFDHVRHVRPGMPRDTEAGYSRPVDGEPDPWSPSDPRFGGFWEGGKHWSEVLADDAEEYLARAAKEDAPFFMYLAFNAPHDPRQSPEDYLAKYPVERIEVPKSFQPEYPHKDAIGCGKSLRDERLAPFPRTKAAIRVHRREYFALVSHLDAQVGRILDALEATGKAKETYVFFTSDHGLAVGHHGLVGKQNLYEHSVRVPFVVRGPGVPAGVRVDTPIYLQDVMPTTLELAGVERPAHVDFQSLVPILRDPARPSSYTAIYGAYLELQRSVIEGRHKLILYPRARVARIYDLEADPFELKDLFGSSESAPIARRLFSRLKSLQTSVGDTLSLAESFPDL